MTSWQPLGVIRPELLAAARIEAHYAAIVLASVASSMREPVPDDSHSSLIFEDGEIRTQRIPAPTPFRFALDLERWQLVAAREDGIDAEAHSLAGRTLAEALSWASEASHRLWPEAPRVERRRFPDFPAHAIADGAPFSEPEIELRRELERYFADAALLLGDVADAFDGASPVRLWPHHFDIATLIPVDGKTFERTVGVGLSPGDSFSEEPYWYVTPWPAPKSAVLPASSPPGRWQSEPFLASVSRASELDSEDQEQRLRDFLRHSIRDALVLLR
ncbi:MAG: hypothetical protein RL885_02670 [Planctomycetota bacterium]